MAALSLDIVIAANAAFELPLTWQDRHKVNMPLSSYNAKMQVRLEKNSPEALITVTSGGNGGITLAEEGDIDVFIGASVTAGLMAHLGKTPVYDLVLTHKTIPDIKHTLIKGNVTIDPGVTR